MKPIVQIVYNGNGSVIDMSLKAKDFEEQLKKELNNKRYSRIVSSPIQLYFDLIINPNPEALVDAFQQNGVVFVKISKELEGDGDVYSLQLGLSRLTAPEGVEKILVLIRNHDNGYRSENVDPEKDSMANEVKYTAIDPKWTLDEVILTKEVRTRLERATKIIKNKDTIFDTLGYSRVDKSIKSIICFYGPAGTGKTITAHAIAKLLNKKIVISSYAQIESKYVGDGAKNLRKIFKDTEQQDAVLFMDECDSFLSKRIENTDSGSDKHYNRMSNELFQLLEDYSGCVVFATNMLTDVDKAFKSRIVDSIYFPLPDKQARVQLLKKMCLPETLNAVFGTETELEEFAGSLEGFSGRDIRKSLLLSYADISDEIKEKGLENYVWTINAFKVGFDDVRNSFTESTDSESIPLDELQKFTDRKRFNRKQFELAKHAILVDEDVDDREYLLLQDLSRQLMNVELENRDIKPEMTVLEICEGVNEIAQKRVLVDVAIRVVSIDGEFSDNEKIFIRKLCGILGYTEDEKERFISYGDAMANAYAHWIAAINDTSNNA